MRTPTRRPPLFAVAWATLFGCGGAGSASTGGALPSPIHLTAPSSAAVPESPAPGPASPFAQPAVAELPECTEPGDGCRFWRSVVLLRSAPALLPEEVWTYLHPLAQQAGEMDDLPPSELLPKRLCGEDARLAASAAISGTMFVDGCNRAPLFCSAAGHHVETRIYARRGPGGDPVPWILVTLASTLGERELAQQERDVRALLIRAEREACPTR